MTVKFLIRKEGRRTVEETKARVYVRFKDGRRLDVTAHDISIQAVLCTGTGVWNSSLYNGRGTAPDCRL